MTKIVLLGWLFIFFGCSSGVSKEDLSQLNGYWEIEQVVFPDGNSKEYKVSTTIDYIQMEGLKGFRKKVSPKFDGTYETSDDAETFTILETDGSFTINYKTELSEWSEKLVALDAVTFSVVNAEGLQYDYKRFEPISIEK
ncbi:hypothetical protein [Pricia sp.]|uniref:hypothetical protein n=1 Tax=Pricia sp. TaxID=2268138 RepID=UPI00359385CB